MSNLLDGQIERAKADANAVIVVYGVYFHDHKPDETFGFTPGQGLHNIHMMQGNSGKFASENQVKGDGALFIRFTGGETVALFVRFATQVITTNPRTGAPA